MLLFDKALNVYIVWFCALYVGFAVLGSRDRFWLPEKYLSTQRQLFEAGHAIVVVDTL